MKMELEPLEARLIGALIEKQITTPDQYPLSLNALVNACNQRSNREPVMTLDEATVQRTVDALSKRHLVVERSGFGSRVAKYQHRFCNTEFGTLKFSPQELAIVCELLLRGPQTPGELRSRASRLAAFADVGEVEAALETLMRREDGPFVAKLPREPGRRESRFAQVFTGEVPASDGDDDAADDKQAGGFEGLVSRAGAVSRPHDAGAGDDSTARIDRLEAEVRRLRTELDGLKQRLGE